MIHQPKLVENHLFYSKLLLFLKMI